MSISSVKTPKLTSQDLKSLMIPKETLKKNCLNNELLKNALKNYNLSDEFSSNISSLSKTKPNLITSIKNNITQMMKSFNEYLKQLS